VGESNTADESAIGKVEGVAREGTVGEWGVTRGWD
jgi:hypothetical protein